MTPPPPPTSKSTSATRRGWSQADETKSEALDELHEKLRSVMRQQFRSLEKEKAEQGKLSQKARDANEILVYLRSQRTYKVLFSWLIFLSYIGTMLCILTVSTDVVGQVQSYSYS